MLLNPLLFEELYNYKLKYNLDMIEFSVYHQKEGKKRIFFPNNHEYNHFHNFRKNFVFQPELSNLIFYIPNTNNYSHIFCSTIWNKIIRNEIVINSIKYIEYYFKNTTYLIAADDTIINILNFNFAHNYSNIYMLGYLYNNRKNSISRIGIGNIHDLIVINNYLLYSKFLYKYVKDFKKDLNFLFYDLKYIYSYIMKFKDLNASNYISATTDFFKEIINDNISNHFKIFIKNLILKLEN